MTALVLIFGLSAGNLIYQMFMADPNFLLAFERSFFQAVAVATYAYLNME